MAQQRTTLMTKQPQKKPESPVIDSSEADDPQDGPDGETIRRQDGQDTVSDRHKRKAVSSRLPTIEGYEIEGIIGRGGMGIVYRARDIRLNRTVALKTVQVARSSRQTRQRIETEARSLAKLNHPGVVRIFEVGYLDDSDDESSKTPFIAMEYVHGPSLDRVNEGNPVKPKTAAEIVYELARTLAVCHKEGVVHRDLKPGNVLMASPVEPKLTDFGLARIVDEKSRLTKTGEIMGTPAYMAPEQASGVVKNVGASADIYGLGALLYDLLTGRPPFMAPDPVQTIMQVITKEPAPPSTLQPKLPRDLETITLKCLQKKPKHRYESCDELASDLRCFLQNKPISAKPAPTYRKALMWVRRHPVVSSMIGLVVATIFAAFAGFSFHIATLQHELDRSQRIINEGRSLSKWLLDDFTAVLQSPKGLTYQRSELANRTQQYLNALLKESGNDRELKTELAYAFTKLAELQGQADTGSLGQTEQAEVSLHQAELIIQSLGGLDSELAQKVQCMIHMQLAGKYLVSQDFDKLQIEVARTNEILGKGCVLNTNDQLALRCHTTQMEFEIALAKSETGRLKDLANRLRNLSEQIIENDFDKEVALLSIFAWARANRQWLEPMGERETLLEILEEARGQATELAGDNPTMDSKNVLANLNSEIADIQYRSGQMNEALKSYHRSLQQWEQLYRIDSRNTVAIFNVAHNWQQIGEAHTMLGQLDQTVPAFQQAEKHFQIWARQLDSDLSTLPAWLQFEGSRAGLYIQQGELDKARTSIAVKINGMQKLADANVEFRRALGDALMTSAMIDAQACIVESTKWANYEPHRLEQATTNAVGSLNRARDHFQKMESDGVGSQAIRSQMENCESVAEVLQNQLSELQRLKKNEVKEDF